MIYDLKSKRVLNEKLIFFIQCVLITFVDDGFLSNRTHIEINGCSFEDTEVYSLHIQHFKGDVVLRV